MYPVSSWDPSNQFVRPDHGAVFNLEFTPDGSLLVAACEKKSIMVFDPLRAHLVNHVQNAHNDCVNCVRFLDSRMFATCSDDMTVALWDIRFLKNKIRSLKGHSNWVKNIEYASNVGLLVTSGFDGSIYTWDINRYTEGDVQFKRVFHTEGLMRTKLSPDNTKLILCTTSGYLMVIHNLNLDTLAADLQAFKPNMYRLMQLSNSPIHLNYNHLFTAKRNRIELICDFPNNNDAEVISSLQVHPHGWCILSRNTSSDDNSEFTCVHDIQESPNSGIINESLTSKPDDGKGGDFEPPSHRTQHPSSTEVTVGPSDGAHTYARPVVHIRFNCRPRPSSGASGGNDSSAPPPEGGEQSGLRNLDVTLRISTAEARQALEAIAATLAASTGFNLDRRDNAEPRVGGNSSSSGDEEEEDTETTRPQPAFIFAPGSNLSPARTLLLLGPNRRGSGGVNPPPTERTSEPESAPPPDGSDAADTIHQNQARLTHYVTEPNVGRGFIKELCFSTDGRLVCSPFGQGVRLLSFNPSCSELCDCVPTSPVKLYEVTANMCHPSVVVSTKFSPTHCLLVSGCLNGKICFHYPRYM